MFVTQGGSTFTSSEPARAAFICCSPASCWLTGPGRLPKVMRWPPGRRRRRNRDSQAHRADRAQCSAWGRSPGCRARPGGIVAAAATPARSRHVLVLSVDGLHQSDLAYYVARHPRSALAALVAAGTEYTQPGRRSRRTGLPAWSPNSPAALPRAPGCSTTTPSTTACCRPGRSTAAPPPAGGGVLHRGRGPLAGPHHPRRRAEAEGAGAHRAADQHPDPDPGLCRPGSPAFPGRCRRRSWPRPTAPQTLTNPAALRIDAASCLPVYPHSYLKVNTVFEVAWAAGLRTAWSDKHAAYEILNGPSGAGV